MRMILAILLGKLLWLVFNAVIDPVDVDLHKWVTFLDRSTFPTLIWVCTILVLWQWLGPKWNSMHSHPPATALYSLSGLYMGVVIGKNALYAVVIYAHWLHPSPLGMQLVSIGLIGACAAAVVTFFLWWCGRRYPTPAAPTRANPRALWLLTLVALVWLWLVLGLQFVMLAGMSDYGKGFHTLLFAYLQAHPWPSALLFSSLLVYVAPIAVGAWCALRAVPAPQPAGLRIVGCSLTICALCLGILLAFIAALVTLLPSKVLQAGSTLVVSVAVCWVAASGCIAWVVCKLALQPSTADQKHLNTHLHRPTGAIPRSLQMALRATTWLSVLAGIALLFDWSYLRAGYTTIPDGRGDTLSAGGAQIWGADKLMLFLLLLAWLGTLALGTYWARWRKSVSPKALALAVAAVPVALLLAPRWMDFQVRHYNGPSQGVAIHFGYRLTPLYRYSEETQQREYTQGDTTENYSCISSRRWKIAGLELHTHLYPILDAANELAVLRQHCTRLAPDAALPN